MILSNPWYTNEEKYELNQVYYEIEFVSFGQIKHVVSNVPYGSIEDVVQQYMRPTGGWHVVVYEYRYGEKNIIKNLYV